MNPNDTDFGSTDYEADENEGNVLIGGEQKPKMDEDKRKRLFQAIETSYRNLEKFREVNKELVEEYAGPSYTDGANSSGSKYEKYINLIQQAIEAYTMVLVGNEPRVLLSTMRPQLRAFAEHFQTALNNLIREIELGEVFEEWVRNAFFSIGIIKVHLADSGEVMGEGDILMDPGKPFASVIPIDDWIHDTAAKKWTEVRFCGDMYRIPFEDLKNADFYDQKAVKELQPSVRIESGEDRVEELSREFDGADEFEPMIDLADIYIPREGMIYTFAVDSRREFTLKGEPLAVMEWVGEETGPYHQLCLAKVPENIMPASTAAGWLPTERLINNIMRKSARQARRSKEIGTYSPAGADSAKTIKNAADGEMVQVQRPEDVGSLRLGGVDAGNHAFMLQVMQIFNKNAGNIDLMLGLGASTDTVGQEKLVHGAASRREESMQKIVISAASRVIRNLAQLLWIDEFKTIPGQTSVDGFPELVADSTWKPGDREGEFKDYDFRIDVYSMQYQGPAQRAGTLTKLLQEIYAPLMPMLMQQGGTIDMVALTKELSELLDAPRLKDIIKFTAPIEQQQSMGDGPRKAPVSNRTYTRRNLSGDQSGMPDASAVAQAQVPKS